MTANRPRRALLFMPADSPRKIEKSLSSGADAVILDLEDGVTFSQKEAARQSAQDALRRLDFGTIETWVRLNPWSTGLTEQDLNATSNPPPDGYILAKTESAQDLQRLAAWLDEHGLAQVSLMCMIESARGVVKLGEIVHATPRLVGLIFGAEDTAASLGARRSPSMSEVSFARQLLVLQAKSADLQAFDTPFTPLDDLEGLRHEAEAARALGYDGKTCIHPKHIAPLLAVFSPSPAEIAAAQALIDAFNEHEKSGQAVFTYEGRMVDAPMLKAAQTILSRAAYPPKESV